MKYKQFHLRDEEKAALNGTIEMLMKLKATI